VETGLYSRLAQADEVFVGGVRRQATDVEVRLTQLVTAAVARGATGRRRHTAVVSGQWRRRRRGRDRRRRPGYSCWAACRHRPSPATARRVALRMLTLQHRTTHSRKRTVEDFAHFYAGQG